MKPPEAAQQLFGIGAAIAAVALAATAALVWSARDEAAPLRDELVTAVANGDEAIRVSAAEPFDVGVLDLMLPGVDGITVCRAIRLQKRVRRRTRATTESRSESGRGTPDAPPARALLGLVVSVRPNA